MDIGLRLSPYTYLYIGRSCNKFVHILSNLMPTKFIIDGSNVMQSTVASDLRLYELRIRAFVNR